jgi:FKBP-type peptidyl-prolyl cis-trans isomerase
MEAGIAVIAVLIVGLFYFLKFRKKLKIIKAKSARAQARKELIAKMKKAKAAQAQAQKEKTAELKRAYDEALAGTDKQEALNAGRTYLKFRRGGFLTATDEAQIGNDIAVMKT